MNSTKISSLLRENSAHQQRPDGSAYRSLSWAGEETIAKASGLSLLEIECRALEEDIVPERYSRNQKSFSSADQLHLLRSHVAIIGLGGLGGAVTEILARTGVGKLTLVDGDCFDESNLNRQLLSSPDNIGKGKAATAAIRVAKINPAIESIVVEDFFTGANSLDILSGVQLVTDCLDTITDRLVLEKSCSDAGIPLVSAAIGGSSGQAVTVLPGDFFLHGIYGGGKTIPQRGIEATLGTLAFAAVYMAAVECAEVVTILLGKEPELRNRLFLADVREHTSELIDLRPAK